MYHPTTRLLTILELLQTHAQMSGEELARRLEVEPRSVRRYVLMLQEMGMPVEGVRGPGGGYRLRPGFKLPPLLFTEEEATAVVLGLLGTPWLEVDLSSMAVGGALMDTAPLPVDVSIEGMQVCSAGFVVPHDASELAARVAADEVEYVVGLPGDGHETEVFFSDLSYDYVRINAEYTT